MLLKCVNPAAPREGKMAEKRIRPAISINLNRVKWVDTSQLTLSLIFITDCARCTSILLILKSDLMTVCIVSTVLFGC